MDLLYTFSGLAVGIVVGMTGVGGGSLMTPLLVLLFGVSPATAVGTDLLYAAITKSAGSLLVAKRGLVVWIPVLRLAAGSIPAALATIIVLHQFAPQGSAVGAVITSTLGAALLLTALAVAFKNRLHRIALAGNTVRADMLPAATVATGVVLGTLVTLSSVGAGALGIVALFLLYPGIATPRIVASDIVHAVPLTLVAGLGHASLGNVDWNLLVSLLLGSIPGIYIGSTVGQRLPESASRAVLATVLAIVGGKLVW